MASRRQARPVSNGAATEAFFDKWWKIAGYLATVFMLGYGVGIYKETLDCQEKVRDLKHTHHLEIEALKDSFRDAKAEADRKEIESLKIIVASLEKKGKR